MAKAFAPRSAGDPRQWQPFAPTSHATFRQRARRLVATLLAGEMPLRGPVEAAYLLANTEHHHPERLKRSGNELQG
jgi:hypothetical protein